MNRRRGDKGLNFRLLPRNPPKVRGEKSPELPPDEGPPDQESQYDPVSSPSGISQQPPSTTFQYVNSQQITEKKYQHYAEIDSYNVSVRRNYGAGQTVVFVTTFILIFLLFVGIIFLFIDLHTLRTEYAHLSVADVRPVGMPVPRGGSRAPEENSTYIRAHWDFTTAPTLRKYVRYPVHGDSVPGLDVEHLTEYTVCCHALNGHFICSNGMGFAQGLGLESTVVRDMDSGEEYITVFVESTDLARRPCTLSFTKLRPPPTSPLQLRTTSK